MFADEELIRWGWPEDVWFHVDKVSSAHVYLRLKSGETMDDIPSNVLDDCVQLVKDNSIEGSKMNSVDIVYTMWSNLKKTADMDVGQVGFHNNKEVRHVKSVKKINEIVKRLNKTKVCFIRSDANFIIILILFKLILFKVEKVNVDLRQEREERDRKERENTKAAQREMKKREREEQKRKEEAAKLRSYESVMKSENMKSNQVSNCSLLTFKIFIFVLFL